MEKLIFDVNIYDTIRKNIRKYRKEKKHNINVTCWNGRFISRFYKTNSKW